MTVDFQAVTVQGQLTYRILDPQKVASLLDFTISNSTDQYIYEDAEKLSQRLFNLIQELARSEVQALTLRNVIHAPDAIATSVMKKLTKSEAFTSLGVEALFVSIQAIKPTPEIGRALEAEAREALLSQADQAIYDRRNSAVEQERRIKENELNTEIAVEAKKRQIRETKADADLAVDTKEQQVRVARLSGQIHLELERKKLVAARSENTRLEADAQGYALEATLHPLGELDEKVLQMLAVQSAEPRRMVSMALKELAQNASKICSLNISPDLLETLIEKKPQ
jgi:hypothetical protein